MNDSEILSLTPELPADFKTMLRDCFIWQQYLFVWKNDAGYKTAYCTSCRREFNIDINNMKTVTRADETLFYEKKHNKDCNCPKCGANVIYKDRNRGRGKLWQENYLYYIQPLSDGGIILRSFYVHLSHEMRIDSDVEYSEHQRVYYSGGKAYRFQRRPKAGSPYFYFCDWYNAETAETNFEWLPMSSVHTSKPWAGRQYAGFKGYASWIIDKNALNGDFKYSCLKEYIESENEIEYRDSPLFTCAEYLALYQKNPSLIEKMMKQGFKRLVWYHLEKKNLYRIINFRKPDFYTATKLNKHEIKEVASRDGCFVQIRKIFEYQMNTVYGITAQNATRVVNYYMMSIDYLDEWIERVKNNPKELLNKQLKYFRKQKIRYYSDYEDYKKQLKKLKMPLTEENLYPHNFDEAHKALTVEINRRATAKKRAAAAREEKKFRKRYKSLLRVLFYEDGNLLIRPAKGDAELLEEANALSHCVYANYRQRYKKGSTIICLIRDKQNPEQPFYTLEIDPALTRVVQCRGKGNRGTTPEVEAFKNKWFNWIQQKPEKEKKLCQKTA